MTDEVITGSRARSALLAVGGVGMTALCAWVLTLHSLSIKGMIGGWVGTPFFAVCTLMAAWQTWRPSVLTLGAGGFSYTDSFGRLRKVTWTDIEPLFVWSFRSSKVVAWRYLPGRKPKDLDLASRANSAFGLDGALPNTFPGKAEDTAVRMNARREAALSNRAAG